MARFFFFPNEEGDFGGRDKFLWGELICGWGYRLGKCFGRCIGYCLARIGPLGFLGLLCLKGFLMVFLKGLSGAKLSGLGIGAIGGTVIDKMHLKRKFAFLRRNSGKTRL